MKKIKLFTLLGALSTLFMGCPYTAEMPLDQPSVKTDDKLLGKWEQKTSSDYAYTVTKEDDFTYKIEKKTVSSGDITVYKGFLSDIGGTKYMNLWEINESATKAYYFYKIEVTTSGSKVTMLSVTENIDEKFTSSAEMKDFFKKNQLLSFFFEKEEDVYIKAD